MSMQIAKKTFKLNAYPNKSYKTSKNCHNVCRNGKYSITSSVKVTLSKIKIIPLSSYMSSSVTKKFKDVVALSAVAPRGVQTDGFQIFHDRKKF